MRFKIISSIGDGLYGIEDAPRTFHGEVVTLDEVEALEQRLKEARDALEQIAIDAAFATKYVG